MRISDWSSDVCSSDLRCSWRSPGAGRHDKPLTLVKGQEFGTQETRDDWQAPSEPEADAGHPRMLAGIAAGGFDEIGRVAEATRPDVADVGREAAAELVAQAQAEAGIAQALADVVLVVVAAVEVGLKLRLQDQPVGKQYLRSEEHTSELQSLMRISYAVFSLKKEQESNINR